MMQTANISQAILSSCDGLTSFSNGEHTIRFRTSPRLERYTSVKEWDGGYLFDGQYGVKIWVGVSTGVEIQYIPFSTTIPAHKKSPESLDFTGFSGLRSCGGISRARTYDLHDVNVAL